MSRSALLGLLGFAGSFLFVATKRQSKRAIPPSSASRPPLDALAAADRVARKYTGAVAAPVWIAAGLADYLWHRRTRIETTSGTKESVMHWLLLMEGAPVIVAPLLLEINAGVLGLMILSFLTHQVTAMWDVGITVEDRVVLPGEQHVHSFLEMVPFGIVSLFVVLHWSQFLALFGVGKERPRFNIRLSPNRPPARYVIPVFAATALLDLLPHAEEFWRCRQAQNRGLTGRDTPEQLPLLFGDSQTLALVPK